MDVVIVLNVDLDEIGLHWEGELDYIIVNECISHSSNIKAMK